MKKIYEYKIVSYEGTKCGEENFLRRMGEEGWELVSVVSHDKYYFKRKKIDVEDAIKWMDGHFYDNSHHSGRGEYSLIETCDFDSLEEMFDDFRKAMRAKG